MKMKFLTALALMFWANAAWSYTVAGNTYTTNGSESDVQAAVNAAPDNGTVTVVIPNGTYTWTGSLIVHKSLNLAGQSAAGVTINDSYNGILIDALSSSNGNLNIYWLIIRTTTNIFSGTAYGELVCDRTEPSNYTVLVHDCTLDSNTDWYFNVIFKDNGIVMWNCNFPNTGGGQTSLTGIDIACEKYGYTGSWNTPDTWGTQDTTGLGNCYIENCTFAHGTSSMANCEDGSRVVWRYNTITDGGIFSHGWDTGSCGVREMEVYNNTFVLGGLINNGWVSINGGSGVFFNNAFPDTTRDIISLVDSNINRVVGAPMVCQTGYPSAKQVGSGWSVSSNIPYGNPSIPQGGIGYVLEPVYVWNNSGAGTSSPTYVHPLQQTFSPNCSPVQDINNFVKINRDYYINTAKPGYTAYTYPHPLHTAYAVGGGPTPTPTPTATPHPTPGAPTNLHAT